MKTDLFQSCGHCWVFQIYWHIDCSTFAASSFRIWNSSTEIPSPPLALFRVMLPKAYLTLDSRLSGSGWVITPLWLSGSWRSFLYSSSVYSCHLFLISSASIRSIPFLSIIEPIFAWNVPLVSLIFLKRSLVFPIILSVQAGFAKGKGTRDQLANIGWILEKAREFQKNIYFCFIYYTKSFDCVDHNKLCKILKDIVIPNHLACLLRNLYVCQEATVKTGHEIRDWFQIEKEYIKTAYCHLAYLTYMHHSKCPAGWSTSWNQDCREKYQ